MTVKAKTTTAKRKPDIETYKFDTSSYIVINTQVRRDTTGRLIVKDSAGKKIASKR